MRRFSLFFVLISFFFLISLQPVFSQTIIPGGNVSGTWTVTGSPYNIQGNITIPIDSTLNIQPGVVVNFEGNYTFTVNGFLQAVGTASDSIHFTASTDWGGITINPAPDTSYLTYCAFSDGGGILCNSSSPVISYCTFTSGSGTAITANLTPSCPEISHCNIEYYGQGIYWISSLSGTISDCNISHCTDGGGIYIGGGEMTIIDCIISNNTSYSAGTGGIFSQLNNLNLINCIISDNYSEGGPGCGVECQDGDVTLTNCTINGNVCYNTAAPLQGGGAIAVYNGNATLTYCSIYDNYCENYVGGISVNGGDLTVDHCTIDGNSCDSPDLGCGISMQSNNTALITNSIISDNSVGSGIYNSGTLTVEYTDFYNNPAGNISGTVPAGFGTLSTTNTNGDSCDVFYNIYLDPLFVDSSNGDYHLSWADWPTPDSTKSPCIDAGDPLSPPDPDSTITDMGMFSFNQSVPVELVSFTAELNKENVELKWITATETNNSGFEIERKQESSDWINVGFVRGHGTTTEANTYSYSDDISSIRTKSITYRLKQIDYNGGHKYSNEVSVEIFVPIEFKLCQNYPNPFNPSTKIKYSIPHLSNVIIKVFGILGNEIETLVNEEKPAGTYELTWDAANLPSGVYFYQLRAGEFVQTKKMILLK